MNNAVAPKMKKIFGPDWIVSAGLFDQMNIGIIIVDHRGLVCYFNKDQIINDNLDPNNLLDRNLGDVYNLNSLDSSIVFYCMSVKRPVMDQYHSYVVPGNQVVHANKSAVPIISHGKLAGCIAFTRPYFMNNPATFAGKNIISDGFDSLIGQNSRFLKAIQMAKQAADTHSPVLIYGETGTGKELIANSIHRASGRTKSIFMPVNCAAVPAELFESLMFGAKKGAYTGAEERPGLLSEANKGTLYLDELDSMPLNLQTKFLRVLQDKKIWPVGSLNPIEVDFKLVSSLSRHPLEAISQGLLRNDLFYRLSAVVINLPPLRERLDDLTILMDHFIKKHNIALNKQIKNISSGLMSLFKKYLWPGNVRELEHVLLGAMTLVPPKRQTLGVEHLPEYFQSLFTDNTGPYSITDKRPQQAWPDAPRAIAQQHKTDRSVLAELLQSTFGNVAMAAKLAKVSPQTMHYRIKKYGLNPNDYKI